MIRTPATMRTESRSQMRGGTGTTEIRHLFETADFAARVRLCSQLTLPVGASIGPHTHENEDELYVIIAGAGVVEEGATRTTVTAGDAVLTGRGGTHSIANTGTVPLVLLAVIVLYPEKHL